MTTTNATMNAKQRSAYQNVLDFVKMRGICEIVEVEVNGFDYCKDVQVSIMTEWRGLHDHSCYQFFIGPRGGIYTFDSNSNQRFCKYYEVKDIFA